MRKLILGLLATSMLALPAAAADLMPTKAPARTLLTYPYEGSGPYWGINAEAAVAQASANGTFAGSLINGNLNATGGAIGGTFGYQWGFGMRWLAVQVSADYQNIAGSTPAAMTATGPLGNISVASRWSSMQVIKAGGFDLMSWLPSFGIQFPTLPQLPSIPNGLGVTGTAHPYVMAGFKEEGLQGTLFSSSGTTVAIAPVVGAGIMNQVVDSTGKLTGGVIDVYAGVAFFNRGLTVSGLFAQPGIPPMVGTATGTVNTTYFTGVSYDF